jgi:hypothetical protein
MTRFFAHFLGDSCPFHFIRCSQTLPEVLGSLPEVLGSVSDRRMKNRPKPTKIGLLWPRPGKFRPFGVKNRPGEGVGEPSGDVFIGRCYIPTG